jgi:hypothetical protein
MVTTVLERVKHEFYILSVKFGIILQINYLSTEGWVGPRLVWARLTEDSLALPGIDARFSIP